MYGALLSEVWPDMTPTAPKKKKKKREKIEPQPLTPDEMDRELLRENYSESSVSRKLAGMRVSPYLDNNTLYEYPYESREDSNIKQTKQFNNYRRDYNRRDYNPEYSYPEHYYKNTTEEQMNELLLYIFTGLFFIFVYDNLFKLGKNI